MTKEKMRIEIKLEPKMVKLLDKIAAQEGRSRKNLCEQEILKFIAAKVAESKPIN